LTIGINLPDIGDRVRETVRAEEGAEPQVSGAIPSSSNHTHKTPQVNYRLIDFKTRW